MGKLMEEGNHKGHEVLRGCTSNSCVLREVCGFSSLLVPTTFMMPREFRSPASQTPLICLRALPLRSMTRKRRESYHTPGTSLNRVRSRYSA